MESSFLQGQKLSRFDFVHTVSLDAADKLCLCDDDDVFVWTGEMSVLQLCKELCTGSSATYLTVDESCPEYQQCW